MRSLETNSIVLRGRRLCGIFKYVLKCEATVVVNVNVNLHSALAHSASNALDAPNTAGQSMEERRWRRQDAGFTMTRKNLRESRSLSLLVMTVHVKYGTPREKFSVMFVAHFWIHSCFSYCCLLTAKYHTGVQWRRQLRGIGEHAALLQHAYAPVHQLDNFYVQRLIYPTGRAWPKIRPSIEW